MSEVSLAVKYRPTTFDDVSEQEEIKIILTQQLKSNSVKHGYLFCGPAGCGKTTAARIFANEINKGKGSPIELDAASNNSVDDIREMIEQAQKRSLDSDYKIFIIDECHMITTQGWNAFLKTLEEPPARTIFIMATTDPQKIPATILSRVQRYNFQKISQQSIVSRLHYILKEEDVHTYDEEAIEYIAKLSEGGMRDAITLMDKCLAYSTELTLENVVSALGVVDYDNMFALTDIITDNKPQEMIASIEELYNSGKDIKQFVKQYVQFLLDINKYFIGCNWHYINIPKLESYEKWLKENSNEYYVNKIKELLETMLELDFSIKYSSTPKYDIEAKLLTRMLT